MEDGSNPTLDLSLSSLSLKDSLSPSSTFTVPTTNAKLTFLSAVPLISEVCQLIRSDPFSGPLTPDYVTSQDGLRWRCELRLPSLAAFEQRRTFASPACGSKAEAKQNCAFQAAVALYEAGGLTDELRPTKVSQRRSEGALVDASGRQVVVGSPDEPSIALEFPNPFGNVSNFGSDVFLHVLELVEEGRATIQLGLVCGADLGRFMRGALFPGPGRRTTVRLLEANRLAWSDEERGDRLVKLNYLNNMSAGVILNKRLLRELPSHLALWTPLSPAGEVDWDLVNNPLAEIAADGSTLSPDCTIIVPNTRPSTRLLRFIKLRDDVDTLSPTDQVETADLGLSKSKLKLIKKYPTYQHYANVVFDVEIDRNTPGPVLQGQGIPINVPNMLVEHAQPADEPVQASEPSVRNFPLSLCRQSRLPEWWWDTTAYIPSLERLIHDRVLVANSLDRVGLPHEMDLDLAVTALTPTNANTGYDYQTLEFYGDSVLKLLTTAHLFLDKPRTDEGVLSALRQNSIGNLFLRGRSLAVGLATAVLPALFRTVSWVPSQVGADAAGSGDGQGTVSHTIAYKVLSDTTEAVLGVGWLSGGLPAALRVADTLGMCTGGVTPWHERKEFHTLLDSLYDVKLPLGLIAVEAKLGYRFRHRQLLLTAFTHRSYISATGYHLDRLEFLGDALLEFYVTQKLYAAFPEGSPRSLTFVRARAVSGSTISYIAIKKLAVQEHLLHSSPLLPAALAEAVEDAEQLSWADVARGLVTWLFQPPKVLGDVVEALIGAVWVDSGGSLEAVNGVLDGLYGEVLPLFEVAELRDPISQLMMTKQSLQCTALESTYVGHRCEAPSL